MKQRLLVILSVAGLLISGYLVAKTADPSSVVCSFGGGCETVLASQFSKIDGISVAMLGVAWYLGTLALIWLVYFKRVWAELPLRLWAATGLAFSLYLLYLEKYQIHAYCTWCLTSLGVVVLLNILSWVKSK